MSCNGTSAHGHTVDAKTIYCAALLFGPTYSFCGCVCSTTCLPWIRVMWYCCCICLIMHSLCVSAGASPARQMYTHSLKSHSIAACEQTTQVSQFHRTPANYVCVEMRAESGWVVPTRRRFGRNMSATLPRHLQAAHTWGLRSSMGSSERPPQCVHDSIRTAFTQRTRQRVFDKREYLLPRPRTTCTQGKDCEAHTVLLLWRGMSELPLDKTASRRYSHTHAHTYTMLSEYFYYLVDWLVDLETINLKLFCHFFKQKCQNKLDSSASQVLRFFISVDS